MKFLGKDIKAVICDMDGTLIDSTGIWGQIDIDFFKKRGFDKVPEEYNQMIVHCGLQQGAAMTIERYGFVNDTVEGIIQEWRNASLAQYKDVIPLKPNALELLNLFKDSGVKIALATANDKELYEPCLKRLNILSYFDYIIDVDKVKIGKSSPKIFNTVSDFFGIKPEETLVLEDSLMGLKTAKEAGYITVGVDDDLSKANVNEKKKESYLYITDFEQLIKALN